MFDLSGRCALVTGSSGGIGRAIATALHSGGAAVALSGTRLEALEALSAELGERAHVLPCDLSDRGDAEGLPGRAMEQLGSIDILVNNAGLTRDGLFMRMGEADWQAVLDVNLGATMRLMKAAMRPMMRKRWGRIVNITSVVGTTGNPGQANYAASKAGIVAMTKSFAQEVASRGVTANCVSPGFIETAMTAGIQDATKDRYLAGIPLGRMGEPEEVASVVRFLASSEASYVTGQTIHVNGGMIMV